MAQETEWVDGSAKVTPMIALLISPAIWISMACTSRYFSFKKGDGQVEAFSSAGETGNLITGNVWQAKRRKINIKRGMPFIVHPEILRG
jgi:hypothetical protein